MGHWQQIGRDNAEERKRRAALPWWRRAIRTHAEAALVAAAWIVSGGIVWMVVLGR